MFLVRYNFPIYKKPIYIGKKSLCFRGDINMAAKGVWFSSKTTPVMVAVCALLKGEICPHKKDRKNSL